MYKIIGGDGNEYGPVSAEQLRHWIQDGRANAQTRAQAEGSTDWKMLSEYPEFADAFAQPATPGPLAPGGAAPLPGPAAKVPNYLVQAILCTVCCCMPAGIAAIIYAAQVNSKLAAGDHAGALASSKNAKMWCWISFGVGLPLTILIIVLQVIAGLAEASGQ